jgi:hypothetical protein
MARTGYAPEDPLSGLSVARFMRIKPSFPGVGQSTDIAAGSCRAMRRPISEAIRGGVRGIVVWSTFTHARRRTTADGRRSSRWFMRIKAGAINAVSLHTMRIPSPRATHSSSFGLALARGHRLVNALRYRGSLCAQTPPLSRQRPPSTSGRAGPDTSQRSASRSDPETSAWAKLATPLTGDSRQSCC